MLEPVRQYGVARMTPEDTAAFGRHFDWCLRSADAALAGSAEAVLLFIDDLHAALAWGTAQGAGQDSAERTADLARVFGRLLFRTGRLREAQARFEQAAQLGRKDEPAVTDLRHAAAIAKCRVRGEDALRLEVAVAERARAGGDSVAAALAFARAAELVTRFAGMFATSLALDPAPHLALARDLAPHDLQVAAALDVATCGFDGADSVPSLERARWALEAAQRVDDLLLESAALDALTAAHLFRREVVLAYELALRRVDRLRLAADDPSAALEVKDALHVATFCALGAGQLDMARAMAQAQHELAFLRESRDVADDELMAPAALSGDLETAVELGERFLQDWADAGRPPAAGRAITPAAVALAHGLLGDDQARDNWLDVVAEIRGVRRDQASRGTGFGEVFDALVLLDQDRPDEAFDVLTCDGDRGLYGAVFHQWTAALTAEAAVRCGRGDADRWIAAAEQATVGNPVASAILRRALDDAP